MTLEIVLNDFQQKVNANVRIKSIINNWNPVFFIETSDTDLCYQIKIETGKIIGITLAVVDDDSALLVRGEQQILENVFSGQLNPLVAYSSGLLEVYGDEADKVKLDAVSLVLWGF